MPKECWAKYRGDCSSKISTEHLVSKSLFEQKTIFVQGFEWCLDEEVEIGLSRATAKVLCTHHNNTLSEVDVVGIEAIRAFESSGFSMHGVKEVGAIHGYRFERWLLKTALNVSVGTNYKIGFGMNESVLGIPPPYLVDVAFGDLNLSLQMGAYFLVSSEPYKTKKGEISICPIIMGDEIGGFYFHLRGIDVFLSLVPGHAPPCLAELGKFDLPKYVLQAKPMYRLNQITTQMSGNSPLCIPFEW